MQKITAREISIAGLLIALNIILSRVITIPGIINFGGFPIIFAGIAFGPVMGGIVGTVGDIVSFVVRPTGPFMPHFVLTSALTGIIPGLMMMVLRSELRNPKIWKVFISILTGQVITTVLMVPYFREILFGQPFMVNFLRTLPKQAINIPAYSFMIVILIKALYRAGALQEVN